MPASARRQGKCGAPRRCVAVSHILLAKPGNARYNRNAIPNETKHRYVLEAIRHLPRWILSPLNSNVGIDMNKKFMKFFLSLSMTLITTVTVAAQTIPQSVTQDGSIQEDEKPSTYIVVLQDPPLASYHGHITGLAATNPSVRGQAKLDANSPESVAYLNYLDQQSASTIAEMESLLGRELTITYEYKVSLNGFATEMVASEAAKCAELSGIRFIEREKISYPLTDAGPDWLNADDIWAGLGGFGSTYGESIIVGVIDTGIDPFNPSFAATGDDGYSHTNPLGAGNFLGVCDPANTSPPSGVVAYDPTFPCNDKLIGVWGYTDSDPNPRDTDGHGSHTSSTAAGNVVLGATITTPTDSHMANISGVAPHANIIMYDGCTDGGGCPGSSLSAARDQLVLDGVDVVNYSIGSAAPTGDPWTDAESLQWLSIRDAGIFVATSAGNSGPGAETIGSPADIPWITTVGANSHDRAFLNSITLDNGSDPPITIDGQAMTSGYGPAPVVFAADFSPFGDDARLCADGVFAPGTFSGEIVVCERGDYGRVAKGQTVLDGGAGGYILAQPDVIGGGPGSIATDPHVLPAVHIDHAGYSALQDYIALTGSADGTISGATLDVDPTHGDIMAAFSSRGPNRALPDIIVPSVTAPGRGIWAAYHQGPGGDGDFTYNVIQGTSMSSPHVAGAGALMKALHPTWTPAEIQSALMTTGRTTVLNDDGISPTTATPFDIGSGHVDLGLAGLAGLVLDETTANYQAADPGSGGDPRDLNLASMGDANCIGSCSWTRTVKNPTGSTMIWDASYSGAGSATIAPNHITLTPGATASFDVDLDATGLTPSGQWHFGQVIWTEDTGDAPEAHLPVAVFVPPPDIEVAPDSLESTQPVDTTVNKTLTISNNGAADLHWTIDEAQPAVSQGGGTPVVFWNQPSLGGTGIVSDFFNENSGGTYSAADFQVSFTTQVTEIFAEGFVNSASLSDATQLSWFIYPDNAGEPAGQPEDGGGTELWTFSALPGATGIDITDNNITLDLATAGAPALNLSAGTYWLVVFPSIDTTAFDRWNWFQATQVNAESVLTDPGGNFGTPDPTWTPFSGLGLSFTDVAFRLTGIINNGCDSPTDVPWITSISPDNGTTIPQNSTQVNVTLNSTSLSTGTYNATLCVNSDDPDTPQIAVSVMMEVLASAPLIDVEPGSLASTQPPDVSTEKILTVNNVGSADLSWDIFEDEGALAVPPMVIVDANANVSGLHTGMQVDANRSLASPHTPLAVLYDQTDNVGTNGFPSQFFTDYNGRARGADDFLIPVVDGAWTIETVEVLGSYSEGDGPAPNFDVNFYANNAGLPGTLVYNAAAVVATVDNNGNVTLDLPAPANLSSGTYWLSVEANMAFDPNSEQWFWSTRTAQTGNPYAWEDTDGLFGITACATWQPGASVCNVGGGSDPDSLFRMSGFIGQPSCDAPNDIPWASVSPTNGITTPGNHADVVVTFDSTGLGAGTYDGTLCISHDDPTNPLIEVPLMLTVDASCTSIAPVTPTLTDMLSGNDVVLNWTDDVANLGGYDIHRSGLPYFTVGGGNLLVSTRPPGTISYADTAVITGSALSFFYKVNALNCDTSVTSVSNEVGVFSFEMIAGSP